jgi:hypothetical protein
MKSDQQLNIVPKRSLEFVPPSEDQVVKFVQEFCQRAVDGKGEHKPPTELVRGFSVFLRLAIRIQTRRHNQLVQGETHGNVSQT